MSDDPSKVTIEIDYSMPVEDVFDVYIMGEFTKWIPEPMEPYEKNGKIFLKAKF